MKERKPTNYWIERLAHIAQGITGLDPRMGRKVEPIQPVSEEDVERFLNAFFTQKRGEKDGR